MKWTTYNCSAQNKMKICPNQFNLNEFNYCNIFYSCIYRVSQFETSLSFQYVTILFGVERLKMGHSVYGIYRCVC